MFKLEKYFYLYRHCFLVFGKYGAAIYNLYEGSIYSIDSEIGKILEKCEIERKSIFEIIEQTDINKKKDILEYLNQLHFNGLGFFSEKKIYIEKLISYIEQNDFESVVDPLPIHKLYLEITRECNLKCSDCFEADSNIRCCSCTLQTENPNKSLPFNVWKDIIFDASLFRVKEIKIIGGEPLLEKDLLSKIIEYIKTLQFPKIVVLSNLLLLDEEIIYLFKSNNVIIETNFYHNDHNMNIKNTGVNGIFEEKINNIRKLKNNGIEIIVNIEKSEENITNIWKTVELIKEIGIQKIQIVNIISNSHKILFKSDNSLIKTEESIRGVFYDTFFRNKDGNSCWNNQLVVTVNGSLLPCKKARWAIMGSVLNKRLKDFILDKSVEKWWKLSKDYIEECKDCEYRYACFDCRPRESENENLYSRNKFCTVHNTENDFSR